MIYFRLTTLIKYQLSKTPVVREKSAFILPRTLMFIEKITNELYQEGYTNYDTDICRIEISIDNVLKMNFSSL